MHPRLRPAAPPLALALACLLAAPGLAATDRFGRDRLTVVAAPASAIRAPDRRLMPAAPPPAEPVCPVAGLVQACAMPLGFHFADPPLGPRCTPGVLGCPPRE